MFIYIWFCVRVSIVACHLGLDILPEGARKTLCPKLPKPLEPFGYLHLRGALGRFPPIDRASLCANQQKNLMGVEAKIRSMHKAGLVNIDDIIVFSVDRAEGKVFKQLLTVNCLPTLTTNSGSLMVADVRGCVDQAPDGEREFLRRVTNAEKLICQGFMLSMSPRRAICPKCYFNGSVRFQKSCYRNGLEMMFRWSIPFHLNNIFFKISFIAHLLRRPSTIRITF